MDNLVAYEDGVEGRPGIRELLQRIELFADLEEGEIQSLSRWVEAWTAEQDALLFREGGHELHLYMVAEGAVSIHKKTSPFESIKLVDIEAGGIMGEMGIIDGEAISASARASEKSVLLTISRDQFCKLVEEDAGLGAKLLWRIARLISHRLRQTTGLLAELSMSKASRILRY